tara:strand:- start:148 stop:288 length:141 start_codon:yes stop_codon:yes gene_type:complete
MNSISARAEIQRYFKPGARQRADFRGYSSVGRALAWHARGRRFKPD